ncbi:unnamed protein product, partial [marine sediment metagenome]
VWAEMQVWADDYYAEAERKMKQTDVIRLGRHI